MIVILIMLTHRTVCVVNYFLDFFVYMLQLLRVIFKRNIYNFEVFCFS